MRKITSLLIVLILSFSVFAASKVKAPKKNQAIVIAKFNFTTDVDRDFIYATRGLNFYATRGLKSDKNNADTYRFADTDCSRTTTGEFCHFIVPKNKTLKLSTVDTWLWDVYITELIFPIFSEVDIPEDADAVYIGSFYVEYKGDDFVITKANRVDEYDLAQDFLKKTYGDHYNLARIETLRPITNNTVDAK